VQESIDQLVKDREASTDETVSKQVVVCSCRCCPRGLVMVVALVDRFEGFA